MRGDSLRFYTQLLTFVRFVVHNHRKTVIAVFPENEQLRLFLLLKCRLDALFGIFR